MLKKKDMLYNMDSQVLFLFFCKGSKWSDAGAYD